MKSALFDEEFIRKLEYLALVSRKLYRGRRRGEHRTWRKGTSLEFYDYRAYQPGDDFRYIDWSIYERLDRLFVKLFAAEEDLAVHLLLDRSSSMDSGTPSKFDYARRVGAALAYVALKNLDRVGAATFAERVDTAAPAFLRRSVFSVLDYFEGIEAGGGTALSESLSAYAGRTRRPGLAIILSDMLDPKGYVDGLRTLLYRGFEIMIIQVLSEEEIEPSLGGALRLVDSESGEELKVTVDRQLLASYQRRLEAHFAELEEFCLTNQIEYVRSSTIVPFEDLILKYLRQGVYLH